MICTHPTALGRRRRARKHRVVHVALMLAVIRGISSGMATADGTPQQSTAATGAIEGMVVYKADTKHPWRYGRYYVRPGTGGLASALVCLDGPELKKTPPSKQPATIVVDQKDLQFTPETVAIRAGDRVRFTNSDSGTHNVSTTSDLHPFSTTIAKGEEAVETFSRAGRARRPIVLGCVFHSQMCAWVYVFDHPYFHLTGTDGRFRLENIPPGEYRLEVVHAPGELRFSRRVDVKAGQTLRLNIELSPDNKTTTP